MKRFRVRIDPGAAAAVLWLLFIERSVWALLSFAAALIHELGHLAAARLLHIEMGKMTISGVGARLFLGSGLLSYRDEALIAAAGPTANLLSFACLFPFLRWWPSADRLLFFAAASLFLALVNLLPLRGFDGGRVLNAVLSSFVGEDFAGRILGPINAVCTVFVWCGASSLCLVSNGNLSLLILSAFLIFRIASENMLGQQKQRIREYS